MPHPNDRSGSIHDVFDASLARGEERAKESERDRLARNNQTACVELGSTKMAGAYADACAGTMRKVPQYTPHLVATMIELYTKADKLFQLGRNPSKADEEVLDLLIRAKIVRKWESASGFMVEVDTEALRIYVDRICNVPLPEQHWVIR